jgi:hypothetical protein
VFVIEDHAHDGRRPAPAPLAQSRLRRMALGPYLRLRDAAGEPRELRALREGIRRLARVRDKLRD